MQNPIKESALADTSLAEIQVFENSEFGKVRTARIDNEPYFVGIDVANILEYQNGSRDINRHVDNEDRKTISMFDGKQNRNQIVINESGLYSLIFGSKLPSAKKFKHWVTSEVLPSIRKNGSYALQSADNVREKEIGLARAEFLRSMALEYNGKSETYKQILDAYAVKELAGEFILPLPEVKQKSYSAGEVGNILGISANKVGSIANKNNLKTEEFGHWVHDKSPYSGKEVESFRYYDNAVAEIKKILEEVAKKEEKK